jgi:hypothetical protein
MLISFLLSFVAFIISRRVWGRIWFQNVLCIMSISFGSAAFFSTGLTSAAAFCSFQLQTLQDYFSFL